MTGIVVKAAGEQVVVPQPTITQSSPRAAFGIDINTVAGGTEAAAYQSARAMFPAGIGPGCKFFGATWGAADSVRKACGYGAGKDEIVPTLCSTSPDTSGLTTLLGGLTAKRRFTVHQEIQSQIQQGRLTLAEYRADQAAVSQAIRASRNAGLAIILPICSSYPVIFDGAPDPVTVLQGLDFDEWGSDFYVTARTVSKLGGDVTNHLRQLTAWAKHLGRPWRLPEFGVDKALADQAAIVQAVVDYCKSDPTCTGFGYWLPSDPSGQWYPDPDCVTVLQQAMAG